MDETQVLSLALLQGLTEFLPISSSAHLVLLPILVDWPDQGQSFDVAVHVGSLAAVIAYFRRELRVIVGDLGRSMRGRSMVGQSRLGWHVLVATIPVAGCGLALSLFRGDLLRSVIVIAITTVGFALALWWADRRGSGSRRVDDLGWRDVLIIGCAQALSLIPGTSRSGITMTAAMALGLSRSGAARFSFLLSIPVIMLAGGLKTLQAWTGAGATSWPSLALGATVAGISAYLTIHFFLRLVERIGFLPFVVYRLALGAVLLVFLV